MINKIFLILFGLSVLIMGILTFFALNQLKSIGFPPPQIVQNFAGYENWHWIFLWISTLLLLILANVIWWTDQKGWALWLTFLFFAIFIMVNTWWLTESLNNYRIKENLETGGLLSKNGIYGAIFCIIAGIGVFFDQFVVLRMREKMFEKPKAEVEEMGEVSAEETPNEKSTKK